MKWAIRLFTIFGIPIYIHLTFLILPLLFYVNAGFQGVFLVLAVFACVTAHELFHSLMAKRFGVIVRGITLFPIGGVASIGSYPRKPSQELMIALAGPSFNIIFAALMFYPLYKLLGPKVLFNPSLRTWPGTIAYAFWINPWLAAFNLLPAFPMDGGRVLRAFLAGRLGLRRATRIAAGIGHFFALVFAFIGIRDGHLMLVIIALFIYTAASSEEFEVEVIETLKERYHEEDPGSP
jgi:stage IV sporulation protein FB